MTRRLPFAGFLLLLLSSVPAVHAAKGGPDADGYTWLDQNEPFVDATIPNQIPPAIPITVADETLSPVTTFPGTPAFSFPFYGNNYTQFRISGNGWMTFDTTVTTPLPNPTAIPSAATPPLTLALFWRDLEPAAVPNPLFMQECAGGVYFRYAANVKPQGDYVQIHWVLYATGVIKIWYQFTAFEDTAGIGIQKNATVGLQPWYRGTGSGGFTLESNDVVMYFPPPLINCTGAAALTCGAPVNGAVTNLAGVNATGYLCSSKSYFAREKVFEFNNPTLANVSFALSAISPSSIKLGMFVLAKDACNEFRCLAGGGTTVGVPFLPPGKYYVVVDGETTLDTGTFTLTATCTQKGATIACQPPSAAPMPGTTTGTSVWQDYPVCAGSTVLDGPEFVYEVPFTGPGSLRARLSNHPGGDLDLLVFPANDLQPSGCLASADEDLVLFDPAPGTYYVMVDGKAGHAGPYDIKITCGVNLDCSTPGTALQCQVPVNGTTTGALNKVDDYACSPGVYDGGEVVYRFDLAATATTSFRLVGPPDLEMLLVQGTCNEARCLASGPVIVQHDLPAGTYYLVVDGKNAAAGDFTIIPICRSELQPTSLDTVLSPGQCLTEDKTAFVNADIGALDVLFVQDATGLQNEFIQNELGTDVDLILAELGQVSSDIQFGLASFRDYPATYTTTACPYTPAYGSPGDWPWRVDQPITASSVALHAAIDALPVVPCINCGGDYPEAYGRAWYETYTDATIGWRGNARKLVIMIGDDVPHDCNVGQCLSITKASRGIDPGPDGLQGTGDELPILDVMNAFKTKGIVPVYIYDPHGPRQALDDLNPNEVFALWNCWMNMVSGLAIYAQGGIFQPTFPGMIRDHLSASALVCHELKLEPSSGYLPWMQRPVPPSISEFEVPGMASLSFDLCPPASTPSGIYNFTMDLLCDGRRVASQAVQVTTSNCGFNSAVNVTGQSCGGQMRTFDASTSTISNCIGPLEYQFRDPLNQIVQPWSTDPTYATIINVAETWTVEVRCQNQGLCPGSTRRDFPVSVTPAPPANAGPDASACVGQVVNLGAAPTGGLTYQWSPTTYLNPPAGNTANPTATPTSPTPSPIAYTLTVTDTASGCSAIDTVVLSIVSGAPTGSVGNNLRAKEAGPDVFLTWTGGALSPQNYNVHRTQVKTELAQPAPTAPVAAGVGNTETWTDSGAMASPPPLYYYQAYGRDCSGNSIFQ